MAQDKDVSVSIGCGGCLTTIAVVILAWALLFGVTVSGHHYGLSGCDSNGGVKVDR